MAHTLNSGGGAMQHADWSIQRYDAQELYQALLIEGCVRSGLYQRLCFGALAEDLGQFDARLVRVVIPALESYGLIQDRGPSMVWVNHTVVPRALYLARHLRIWLDLALRLNPEVTEELTWAHDWLGLETLNESAPLLAQWVVEGVGVRTEQRWLDVGSGTGLIGMHLARHAAEVVLCDRPEVAAYWKNRQWPHNVNTLALNILDEDVPGLFDGVLLCRFVELLTPPKARDLFRKLRQVLNPCGTLCLVGYFSPQAPLYDLFRVQVALHAGEGYVYSLPELLNLASEAGFDAATASWQQRHGYDLLSVDATA
jgi:SAM-dependent methyltransferase